MSIELVLDDLRRDASFMAQLSAWQIQPAQPARFAPIPHFLHPALVKGLTAQGIQQLYAHQVQAIDHLEQGQHVAVVTPTASGKTLCYNLPVLHTLLRDEAATALYLFPTKALAHDQLNELADWGERLAGLGIPASLCAAYDGDTPSGQRSGIRANARLLVTNPDMLHVGILPYHGSWARFLSGLRLVVIDEMHTYRGVFGSHVANVIRRLRRVARFYGGDPQFVLTSATIANPGQLAEQLIEAPVQVVDRNAAPQGEKHILLYNPPLIDPAQGMRRSSVLESEALAGRLIQGGVQTIVFARARLTVEVLLTYIRERMARAPGWRGGMAQAEAQVRGYRGGYLSQERRQIEQGLREGTVRGVVATNALELGIDIGQLQAAVICGYPGTIASVRQQMGRVGRTRQASLAILVATPGPLDQYVISHPDFLLGHSPERALINPDNLMLLVDQVRCAAFELPFGPGESFGRSPFTGDVLALLAEQGSVGLHGSRAFWQGEGYPARQISLRSAGGDAVVIQSREEGRGTVSIGEVDPASAAMLAHEGAIYIHEGQTYRVERLDLDERQAWVLPTSVDYYTNASVETEIQVLARHDSRDTPEVSVHHGDLLVTAQVTDYRRVRRYTHETLGVFPLDYPPQSLETSGYWFTLSPATQQRLIAQDQWRDAPNDYGPNWQEQRHKVRQRDSFRCSACGRPEPAGGQHDVHHRVPFRTFGYAPGMNDAYLEANRLSNLTLLCRACHRRMESGVRTRGGLDGLAYTLLNLAPLRLMCDRNDIGVSVDRGQPEGEQPERDEEASQPAIYIYERIAAGMGFSQQLFEQHALLLAEAEQRIRACGCHHGCPACVGPVPLGPDERPLLPTKQLTLALVQALHGPIAETETAAEAAAETGAAGEEIAF